MKKRINEIIREIEDISKIDPAYQHIFENEVRKLFRELENLTKEAA